MWRLYAYTPPSYACHIALIRTGGFSTEGEAGRGRGLVEWRVARIFGFLGRLGAWEWEREGSWFGGYSNGEEVVRRRIVDDK